MGVYDRQVATAKRLIAKNGKQCQWTKMTTVLDDPAKPWAGGEDVPQVFAPRIAFLPATDGASGFGITKLRDATQTAKFSTYGLMAAQDFTPDVVDMVTCNGVPLVIIAVDTLAPNKDEPILHILSIV